jgi:glutamate dehydrogenase/leucine dehydrogenase
VQNNENEQWDLEEVNHKLRTTMERAADAVIEKQTQINRSGHEAGPIDLRTAALLVSCAGWNPRICLPSDRAHASDDLFL